MSRRFFGKLIFLCILLIFCVIILSFHSGCDPNNGPDPNGTPTGGWNTSPEDSIVQVLLDEFEEQYNINLRVAFFEGEIGGFLPVLQSILDNAGHLDYIAFYSSDLEILRNQGWLKQYPRQLEDTLFFQPAIDAMKIDEVLYGVPIYYLSSPTFEVKGIGVSTRIQNELEDIVVELINYCTNEENSQRIASVVGGISARIDPLPNIIPDGNFEDVNSLDNWQITRGNGSNYLTMLDDSIKYEGIYSLHNINPLADSLNKYSTLDSNFPVNLIPQNTYKLSCWIKAEGKYTDTIDLNIKLRTAQAVYEVLSLVDAGSVWDSVYVDWTYKEIIFEAPSVSDLRLYIYIPIEKVWLDNVSLLLNQ